MRILFVLILLANVVLYGIGQSWFGASPSEEGRDPMRLQQELNARKVVVGK
jgi:hypothetical protein